MLSSRAKFFLHSCKNIRVIFSAKFCTPQKLDATLETSLSLAEKKRRPPFMKNVFLGLVDDIFFQYPDPKNIEPSKNVQKFMKEVIDSLEGRDLSTYDKFKVLVQKGILKFNVPGSYGGIDITYSELLNLYEELKLEPSVSFLLEYQCSLVLQTILRHGSEETKQKYVMKIVSGELTGAYAMSEEDGSNPSSIKFIAKEEDDCFRLSGEKVWVTNAECADFFLVFANNIISNRTLMRNELSVFLVEKNEDIYIEKHNMFGLNGCGLSKVKFKNVAVPKSSLIGNLGEGYQIAGEGLRHPKYIILISILNNLKYFLSSTVSYVQDRKQFPIDLQDCELVKNKLTNITSTIYSFESMLYLTTGILDHYIIDDTLETAILQLYGYEKGLEAISLCMDLLGTRAYDVSFSFERLWRDLKGFSLGLETIDIITLYISLIGIDHAGNNLNDIITKNRNPFNFPGYTLKKVVSNSRHEKDKPKLNLKLYTNLHPSLKTAADQLEYCILRLQYVAEIVLTRHGSDVLKRQLELKRIANVASDIYAMVAILSRSSKSYCSGVQFCDQEIAITNAYCFNAFIRVKNNINDILCTDKKLNDIYSLDIASHILKNNFYSFQHPLKPNIV